MAYYCVDVAEPKDKDGLEAGAPWSARRIFPPENGSTRLIAQRTTSGKNRLLTLCYSGHKSRPTSLILSRVAPISLKGREKLRMKVYQTGANRLDLRVLLFSDADIEQARMDRTAAHPAFESQPVRIQPGQWAENVTFHLNRQAFRRKNGRKPAVQAFDTAQIRRIALKLNASHTSRYPTVIIDSIKAE